MNKYLLWVLLAFQSIPGYCHVFEFKEGTIMVHDFFNKEQKTQPLDSYGDGVLHMTPRSWERQGDWAFKWEWKTTTQTGVTFDPYDMYVNAQITSMFDFVSTEGVAESDWIDMGTYKFPPHTNTAVGYCHVPQYLTSDALPQDGSYYFEVNGRAQGTCDSCGLMSTLWVQCSGRYEIRKHVALKLVDTVLNLAGSTADALYGSTRMDVSGYGGSVSVQIVNPNPEEIRVSFDPNRSVTSMNIDLVQQAQHEQQIYVRGNTSVPGRHEYSVQLKAEFK
ncbi:hypothetical protein U9042_22470 [Escherichia coli]